MVLKPFNILQFVFLTHLKLIIAINFAMEENISLPKLFNAISYLGKKKYIMKRNFASPNLDHMRVESSNKFVFSRKRNVGYKQKNLRLIFLL